MKTINQIFLALFVFYSICYSQMQWVNLNSGTKYRLNKIFFSDSSNGFIVGDNTSRGILLKSQSGGFSWSQIIDNYEQGLESIYFINQNNGFAVGWYGTILKTTDKGFNWRLVSDYNISTEPFYDVYFINSQTGFVVGGSGNVLKTLDGGQSWTLQSISYQELRGIKFISQSTGLIISKGRPAKIFRTTNQGINWNDIYTEHGGSEFLDLQFINQNVGYIVGGKDGEGGIILKTVDGGVTWTKIPLILPEWLKSVSFSNLNEGIAVGTNGIVLNTTNGGIIWNRQNLPTNILNSVRYYPEFAIIAGNEGKIYKSANSVPAKALALLSPIGGENWFVNEYKSIKWNSSGVDNIKIEFSSDSGATWTVIKNSFPAKDTFFVWQVPNIISNKCLIKISDVNNPGSIFSVSGKFSIANVSPFSDKIKLSLPDISAVANDTLLIDVRIKTPASIAFSSCEISIKGFNNNLIYKQIVTQGTSIGNANWTFGGNLVGDTLITGGAGATEITGEGILFRIKCFVPANASGYIPLNITSAVFNTGNIPVELENGGITVTMKKYGDIDLNGTVQTYDASLLLKFLVGEINLSPQQLTNADVNLDGIINSLDASLIIQYVLKLIPSLPAQQILPANGKPVMHNIDAGNSLTFSIPVILNNPENLFSFEGQISFDPSKLVFEYINWPSELSNFTKEVSIGENSINFVGASSQALTSTVPFFNIIFSKTQSFNSGTTDVVLNKIRWNSDVQMHNVSKSTVTVITGLFENKQKFNFSLSQNYPNPFNPSTKIEFEVPKDGQVTLEIYDLLGRLVTKILDRELNTGKHIVEFNSEKYGLSAGVYIYQLKTADGKLNRIMHFIK